MQERLEDLDSITKSPELLIRSIDINDLCHNLGLPPFGGKILAQRAAQKPKL
jgi:hypothetical protein